MVLHLFDTSQYIYSGSKDFTISRGIVEDEGKYRPLEIPCGGLAYVLNAFTEWGGSESEMVFCVDKTPTVKRSLFEAKLPGFGRYKGERPVANKDIVLQKQMVGEMLEQIGVNVVCVEGYEADDVIASLVKYYKDSYERIYIHSKDSDLFYLVDKNVEIQPLNVVPNYAIPFGAKRKNIPNGKHITIDNWEREVTIGNEPCSYDIITLLKMCLGEPSDNIPAVSENMASLIMKNLPKDYYVKCGDNDFVRKYVLDVTNGDEFTKTVLDLIQPVILRYETVELYENELNKDIFRAYAKACSNKYARTWAVREIPIVEETINKYITIYNGGV